MSELFEESVELIRDDGVRVRAVRITPDFDDAERCHGAGVVVAVGAAGATEATFAAVVRPLARAGYFVVAVALSGADDAGRADGAAGAFGDPIEDVEAALLSVKELARGKLGVLGLGGAGPVALAAAAELPHVDAVVCAGGGSPATTAKLSRVRAAVLLHHAARGAALTEDDLAAVQARLARSKAPLTLRRHDADDGFFGGDGDAARIAWSQTRDFLALNLT